MGRLKQVDAILDPGAPAEYRRCALVGNSQRNLIHEYGAVGRCRLTHIDPGFTALVISS
jgi:hypothetical protein